jgi:hypothetical protein
MIQSVQKGKFNEKYYQMWIDKDYLFLWKNELN